MAASRQYRRYVSLLRLARCAFVSRLDGGNYNHEYMQPKDVDNTQTSTIINKREPSKNRSSSSHDHGAADVFSRRALYREISVPPGWRSVDLDLLYKYHDDADA